MFNNLLATEGITVPMALVDFLPVIFFFIASIILQHDLYYKLPKWGFACLAGGAIMVFAGGFYKALWKILYAVTEIDYAQLSSSFFPMQGLGFLIFFLGLLSLFIGKKKVEGEVRLNMSPIMIALIGGQIVGMGGAQIILAILGGKMKKPLIIVMFAISFLFMFAMGYLSSKFDDSSSMHWIAQLTNIVNLGTFLAGTLLLHKNGLKDMKI